MKASSATKHEKKEVVDVLAEMKELELEKAGSGQSRKEHEREQQKEFRRRK